MNFFKKKLLFCVIIIFPFTSILKAEDFFCLEKDGYIYPLFEVTACEKQSEIKINKSEFSYIVDFELDSRRAKLDEYKKNSIEIEKNKEEKLIKSIASSTQKTTETKKIINDKKKTLEQKKIAKLAREKKLNDALKAQRVKRKADLIKKQEAQKKKIKARKEELENKRIARKKKLEEKKKQTIAKKKKLEEEKKLKKEEKKRKELVRKEKIKKEKELKLAKNKELKNKGETITKNEVVNNNLKIVYLSKNIVKKELLPSINPSSEIDFSNIETLDKNSTKNLLTNNSNLIIIIPKDYESFSNVISESEKTSNLVAGTRSVPNPEFNRLQMEMRRTERELQRAQAEAERAFRMTQCMSCGLFTQWGGIALQSKWQKEAKSLQSRLTNLTSSYSSVPEYLDKEILRNYQYIIQNVNAEKKAIFQMIQSANNKYFEKELSINESKDFKVAYNIDPQDKNYNSLINKYSTTDDLTRWQNLKISNVTIKSVVDMLNNIETSKELSGKKELYASLNFEYIEEDIPWWKKLFGINENNTASLNNQSGSGFEIKDERFDSVVIIKTEKGMGSGFFVSIDEILTNYHVIENSSSINIIDKNKKRSSAVVIKKDLKRDLALLKTNIKGKPVTFYSGQLKQGEMVEALGHPKGRKFSLTKGWISAIRKESSTYSATGIEDVMFIQTDAAINPGNSGGPLFYKNEVVGVNTQGLSKDKTEGMNFAIHFSEVKAFLAQ